MYIDVHHHWIPEEHFRNLHKYIRPDEVVKDAPGTKYAKVVMKGKSILMYPNEEWFQIEKRLERMDELGIDMAVMSIPTWHEWFKPDMFRGVNDQMAEIVAKYPKRFVGMAHVPVGEPGALEELERAIKGLGLRGVGVLTHVHGTPLDDEKFLPFYEKAAELNVPIFVHPTALPLGGYEWLDAYNLVPNLGRTLGVLIATFRLIFSGIPNRYPNLRFVMAHLGGGFYIFKNRLANKSKQLSPSLLQKGNAEASAAFDLNAYERAVKQFYFESAPALWDLPPLKCALEVIGSDRIMLGSDYPVDTGFLARSVELIRELPIAEDVRKRISGGNAEELFGIGT